MKEEKTVNPEEQLETAFSILGDGWHLDPVMKTMHNDCLEVIRLSRKEGEEKIRVIISDLQNIKSDFEWLWNNTYPDHESKQSDHFNIPANSISELEGIIDQLISLSPKEERDG